MNNYDIVNIVEKLIGDTRPTGDSGEDHIAKLNQRELIMLVDCLTDKLVDNAKYVGRGEGSMDEVGQEAMDAIGELKDKLGEMVS